MGQDYEGVASVHSLTVEAKQPDGTWSAISVAPSAVGSTALISDFPEATWHYTDPAHPVAAARTIRVVSGLRVEGHPSLPGQTADIHILALVDDLIRKARPLPLDPGLDVIGILEGFGAGADGLAQIAAGASAPSRSAVSRKFVQATEHALAELLAAPLGGLDLVALMVDGVHFAEHVCVVALGIDSNGYKHPLALEEGSTENATLVRTLLSKLRDERGLDVTKPMLVVIDGAAALHRAVQDVFDQPVIQRCQLHKVRNVLDKLPERLRETVARRMQQAYHADSALDAEAQLQALGRELEKTHPGAAASLREGLAETLTVLALDLPPTLARTLRSTNAIDSMIEICREHAKNVKRWRDGTMALRWCAAGMLEAKKQFRRVNGYLHLPALRVALESQVSERSRHTGDAA